MATVLIYGSGAIGSLVGYLLSEINELEDKAIENVGLLGRKSHIESIKKSGLKINFFNGQKTSNFNYLFSSLDELDKSDFSPDIVVVCVKTHSLSKIRYEIIESGILGDRLKDASFILLMNGMGNAETFDLPVKIFEGITLNGVVFSKDGLIELKGKGKTIFESEIPEGIKQFMKARFEEKGFEIEFTSDFKSQQWNKLFANAVINPITALTREKNGIVLSKHLEETVGRIVDECTNVAEEEGLALDRSEVLKFVYSVAEKTSMNTSSMLQDVIKGNRAEIDSINGYVIRLARKHAIDVPVNETLYALVKSIECKSAEK
ncbi:MAG: ketopantoate reductase family protein [Methanotrichaceae archaeon]